MPVPLISALPTVPSYDNTNFESLAPAFLSFLKNTFQAEMNAAIAAINSYDYGAAVNISKVVGLTAGYIPYGAGTSALASNANLNYDVANSRLNTPVLRASTGVLFGTDTAAANTLDDYEEGTWTPVVADAATSGNVGTATTSLGDYTKVGRLVTVRFVIQGIDTTGMTTGNKVYVRGLPFVAGGTFVGNGSGSVAVTNIVTGNYLTVNPVGGHTVFRLNKTTSAGAGADIIVSEITSGSGSIQGVYSYVA